jgi:hypothetical protein
MHPTSSRHQERSGKSDLTMGKKKKKSNIQPIGVWGPYGLYGRVKGDKVIIHKCDLDKLVKDIKESYDPYEDDYQCGQRAGARYFAKDMLDMIARGNKAIKEKYGKD